MASMTSVIVYQVRDGNVDKARKEVRKIKKNVEKQGGQVFLNWVMAGSTPGGTLALFLSFPSAKTYAKAVSSDAAHAFRVRQAQGKSALNVLSTSMLQQVEIDD